MQNPVVRRRVLFVGSRVGGVLLAFCAFVALLGSPTFQLNASGEPTNDDPTFYPVSPTYNVSLTLNLAPEVHQTSTVIVSVTALSAALSGTNKITIRIPSYFSVYTGTPTTYLLTNSVVGGGEKYQDIVWTREIAAEVTETFTAAVIPRHASVTPLHDPVEALVESLEEAQEATGGAMVYVRVGENDGNTLGSIESNGWPDGLTRLSAGFGATDWITRGDVTYYESISATTPTTPPVTSELEEYEPISIRIIFTDELTPTTSTQALAIIHNTITRTVDYSGRITVPVGWYLAAGSTSFTDTLDADERVTHTLTVIPSEIRCSWSMDVGLTMTDPDDHEGRSLIYKRTGGVWSCTNEAEWLTTSTITSNSRVAYFGREIFSDNDTRVPGGGVPSVQLPCDWCDVQGCRVYQKDRSRGTFLVTGQINALSAFPDDSYLARLHILVWAGQGGSTVVGYPALPIGRLLAEGQLDDNGAFSFCLPIPQEKMIFLEVEATDLTPCSDSVAQTVFEKDTGGSNGAWGTNIIYYAFSSTKPVPDKSPCWSPVVEFDSQYVDEWETTMIGRGHWPATMIAYDMREFMKSKSGTGDINTTDERANFVYPFSTQNDCYDIKVTDLPGGDIRQRFEVSCYRAPEILLRGVDGAPVRLSHPPSDAENGDIVDHEYAHRHHDSMDGFNSSGSDFQEGIADWFQAVKRDPVVWTLNRGKDPLNRDKPFYENHPRPAGSALDYSHYGAWLWDILDSPGDERNDQCPSTFTDSVTRTFADMWPSFYKQYSPQEWATDFSWQGGETGAGGTAARISYYYRVYDCDTEFP